MEPTYTLAGVLPRGRSNTAGATGQVDCTSCLPTKMPSEGLPRDEWCSTSLHDRDDLSLPDCPLTRDDHEARVFTSSVLDGVPQPGSRQARRAHRSTNRFRPRVAIPLRLTTQCWWAPS